MRKPSSLARQIPLSKQRISGKHSCQTQERELGCSCAERRKRLCHETSSVHRRALLRTYPSKFCTFLAEDSSTWARSPLLMGLWVNFKEVLNFFDGMPFSVSATPD
jgi:hypothetical protein